MHLALQVVTPWDVSGGKDGKIDYDKLVNEVSHAHIVAYC